MEKLKQYKYIILITLVVLGFAFYWFQVRPTQIRKECSRHLTQFGLSAGISGEKAYTRCLSESGLEK